MMPVTVSIIIPVFNASRFMDDCIRHIRRLDYDHSLISVFVVDNGSTDDSVEILKKHHLEFCIEPDLNVSGLRNLGVKNTTGDIVAFVDSDCYVDQGWLRLAVKELMSDESIGIIGSFYAVPDNPTWVEKAWHDTKKNTVGEVSFLSSGNMLMRRRLFESVGGFSAAVVTGEDYHLCQKVRKAGFKIINNPQVKTIHMGNAKTLFDVVRKERWYGLGMLDTVKNGEMSKPLLLSLSFIALTAIAFASSFFYLKLFVLSCLLISVLPIFTSYYMIRNVASKRLELFFKCIPLSACYIFGRALSIVDLFFGKFFARKGA